MNSRLLDVLDAMREAVGGPLSLSCAYRCPSHNAEVGGVPNSQHVQGCAADVLLPDGLTIDELAEIADQFIPLPKAGRLEQILTSLVVLQLLAYHTAQALGRDIDKPRNLAKSVTVE